MSLVGFIASAPELHFTKAGAECCRMRVGVEQWRKEVDGSFTKLAPTFHDMVAFESTARETYARFRKGDSFVASGYVHEYEIDGREGTVIKEELRFRLHAFPVLGKLNLNDIQLSTIQSWLRTLSDLAPSYRQIIFANVSTVFRAAGDDSLILANPSRARSVRRQKRGHHKVVPWPRERVLAVRDELPARFQLMVWLGAGLGLRQGEIFGLSPDDIDLAARYAFGARSSSSATTDVRSAQGSQSPRGPTARRGS
ncbi:MAG TPA: single-stranded DNA-binding protein [Nocardioides sp.]|uniref:single-stranded DNA-binding protein n=1 Tax=Nocardioides sp. TaxID=35761 RepID=UPI002ED96275